MRQVIANDPKQVPKENKEQYYKCFDLLSDSSVELFNISAIIALNDGLKGSKKTVLKAYDLAIKKAVEHEKKS